MLATCFTFRSAGPLVRQVQPPGNYILPDELYAPSQLRRRRTCPRDATGLHAKTLCMPQQLRGSCADALAFLGRQSSPQATATTETQRIDTHVRQIYSPIHKGIRRPPGTGWFCWMESIGWLFVLHLERGHGIKLLSSGGFHSLSFQEEVFGTGMATGSVK